MRPRHKAAENVPRRCWNGQYRFNASMRPRHKAAENRQAQTTRYADMTSFNEAAA